MGRQCEQAEAYLPPRKSQYLFMKNGRLPEGKREYFAPPGDARVAPIAKD